ncbi:MAG: hypothetical protein JKX83_07705 [Pseudomonadales bacterium]|nr:hypothetical protein [Pseudomonadales bacterium]
MQKTILGWALWLIGIGMIFGYDYFSRMQDDYIHTGAVADDIMSMLLMGLGSVIALVLYAATEKYPLYIRISIVLAQMAAGYLVLAATSVGYMCGAGIGCFW